MIVDSKGKPISNTMAKAIVFVCEDDTWRPLKPYNVPDAIKAPDAMGQMLSGEILELSDGRLYRAERLPE